MSHRKLLLIDDEEDIREVASLTLAEIGGFHVVTAAGGAEGIVTAEAEQPDVILLDVMMPELDGPSTLEQLQKRESTRAIPVIFLTAKVQTADKKRLADLGAVGIIPKPFDPMTLSEEVDTLLASARSVGSNNG